VAIVRTRRQNCQLGDDFLRQLARQIATAPCGQLSNTQQPIVTGGDYLFLVTLRCDRLGDRIDGDFPQDPIGVASQG
jgi:hypothetical protein